MNDKERRLNNEIKIMYFAIQNRIGKLEAEKLRERFVFESKSELQFTGALNELNLLERILWRLSRYNEYLVDLERGARGASV